MHLTRLIYKSRPTVDVNWNLITAIIKKSSLNNTRDHITGLLAVVNGRFLQVLEGPRSKVGACYNRIAGDKQHTEVTLVEVRQVDERLFPDWQMKSIDVSVLNQVFKNLLVAKYGNEDGVVDLPEHADLIFSLLLDLRFISRELR